LNEIVSFPKTPPREKLRKKPDPEKLGKLA